MQEYKIKKNKDKLNIYEDTTSIGSIPKIDLLKLSQKKKLILQNNHSLDVTLPLLGKVKVADSETLEKQSFFVVISPLMSGYPSKYSYQNLTYKWIPKGLTAVWGNGGRWELIDDSSLNWTLQVRGDNVTVNSSNTKKLPDRLLLLGILFTKSWQAQFLPSLIFAVLSFILLWFLVVFFH